jgi:glyoxylase-like metal-dependent hydrolase (beta-lactamase superfamily II)
VTVRVYAMTCGWLTGPGGAFFEGEEGRLRVPVPAYLIEHPRGTAVFDSGLHVETQRDPEARLGGLTRFWQVHFRPGEELGARLRGLGRDPARIDFLVASHLHFDHVGGNADLPNATLVIQRREWDAGRDPDLMARNAYDPRNYDLGQPLRRADGEHDLFGDGRVVCIPTYGHTRGHQSLRVRADSGEIVLTADSCYLRRTLETLHLPALADDREQMLESLRRLRALRDAGARLLFGHDPEQWEGRDGAGYAV